MRSGPFLPRTPDNGVVGRKTQRLTLKRAASFPKAPALGNQLRAASLDQKAYEHQKLVLTYTGKLGISKHSKVKWTKGRTREPVRAGDPVKFTWSIGKFRSVFVGYVYSVKVTGSAQATRTTVVCLGTSKKLSTHHSRVFRNVTATTVVARLAKEVRMKLVVHNVPTKRKQIMQPGLTDWQMLRQLAAQTGHGLFVNGTTIYFIDQDIWTAKKVPSSRVFTFRTKLPPGLILGQNLYNWKATVPEDSSATGEAGDVEIVVDDEVVEYLSEDYSYIDEEGTDLWTGDEVEVSDDYLETYGLEADTTADDLLDETEAVIEEAPVDPILDGTENESSIEENTSVD